MIQISFKNLTTAINRVQEMSLTHKESTYSNAMAGFDCPVSDRLGESEGCFG